MVKIRELRLGNIVEFNGKEAKVIDIYRKLPVEIGGVSKPAVGILCDDFETVHEDDLNPIPINREFLIRNKFVEFGSNLFHKNNLFVCLYPDRAKAYYVSAMSAEIRLDYIHELQNLYYCLTKEELE